ncbi:MAG: DUF452 family protein [Flammeovirgaceae bacterium]|nr:DUF452 family protein [Flammeovirgaceae bacterium]
MNKIWLNKAGNKNCILFFNGWGMDENAIQHLEIGAFDLCMLNDYNPLDIIPEESFISYEKIYLVAWSMGVWAAARVLGNTSINVQKAIAINGTLLPIHNDQGIPKAIFDHTLENWNLRNREKFNMRIFGGRKQYTMLYESIPIREIENQMLELKHIRTLALDEEVVNFKFDCALIGKNDLIFSRDNQMNFWQKKTRIIEMEIPHFPFALFNHWKEIIEL